MNNTKTNNTKTKRALVVTVILALAALLAIGTTLAFLTDSFSTLNVLSLGANKSGTKVVDIRLSEDSFVSQIMNAMYLDPQAGELVGPDTEGQFKEAHLYNILPNQDINKDPVIENIGAEAVYIRVRVLDADGNDAFANQLFTNTGMDAIPGLGLKMGSEWVKVGDYYYYAVGGVATGTGTPLDVYSKVDVFAYSNPANRTSMTVPEKWDYDTMPSASLDLNVQVQAIQSRDFTPDLTQANPWQYSDSTPVDFAF